MDCSSPKPSTSNFFSVRVLPQPGRRHHHFLGMVMRFPQLPLPAANCSFSEVWYMILRATIYVFSTRELSATHLQTSGEIPGPHVGHAGALISSVLYIWGGDMNTRSGGADRAAG